MTVGITFGSFDLCHAGHALMFAECKQRCDYLIVGLQFDPSFERPQKNKPVQSLFERYTQLSSIKYIDEIIPYQYEDEIIQILKARHIDVRFVGGDYVGRDFTGRDTCYALDIEIVYNSREHDFSTSELRRRIESSSNR